MEVETNDLELEWEVSRNNELFPHLYEPLPLSKVTNIYRILVDAEGNHIIPEAVNDN